MLCYFILKSILNFKIEGENPNHLEVLTLPTKMPLDPTFAPAITIRVFDSRLGRDPLIASTYMPLAEFTPWVEVHFLFLLCFMFHVSLSDID